MQAGKEVAKGKSIYREREVLRMVLHCWGTKVVAEMQNGALRTAAVARARGVAGKYVINPRRAGQ